MRYFAVAAILSLFVTPAFAAEEWACDFTVMYGSAKGLGGGPARIRIEADKVVWLLPPSPGQMPPDWTEFPYRLLVNNKVGLVAGNPEASIEKDIGPIVGSSVMALNKQSGELHVGSVGMLGANEIMAGHCKSK